MATMIDFEALLNRVSSYTRMDLLLQSHTMLEESQWVKLFIETWQSCDTKYDTNFMLSMIFKNKDLGELFKKYAPDDMLAEWDALPDELTVYRGCYEFNQDGFCWTLSIEETHIFTNSMRYAQEAESIILVGKVSKHDIFYMNQRENEVFVKPENVTILEKY